MDANKSLEAKNSKISELVAKKSLHDVHENAIFDLPITTRLGSKGRIDFILATEGIIQMIRATGYPSLHEGINSDHVMLWVGSDLDEFFSSGQARPSSPQPREFSFDNLQVRGKFLTKLRAIHKHQNLENRIYKPEIEIKLLGISNKLVRKYNAIDHELTKSIRGAVNKAVE